MSAPSPNSDRSGRASERLLKQTTKRTLVGQSSDVLASDGIAISMDGKGAWRNNVFVDRLWRSVKYEEVYLISFIH